MKNNFKLIGFGIILTFTFIILYFVSSNIQNANLKEFILNDINQVKTDFEHLKESDTNMLSSNLEILVKDPLIKNIYLEKDREKLYSHLLPLFTNLKAKYKITHWYFILPDGKTFLRMHEKEIYNDEIARTTFQKSQESGKISSGIELGKTAYALRVVIPYYEKEELIGYIELGEGIDHFLESLSKETKGEFVLIDNKQFLDKDQWASVREIRGLRNNWDDLENYLAITDILEGQNINECLTENNMGDAQKGKFTFNEVVKEGVVYKCTGFELIDANDFQAGFVFFLMDIDSHVSSIKKSNLILAGFLFLIFFIMTLMGYFLVKIQRERK